MSTFDERRRSPRLELVNRIRGHVQEDTAISVREISLGGMSLETAVPLSVGDIHEFKLTLGDGSVVLLRGRVLRSVPLAADGESPVYVSGVQFIPDDTDDPVAGLMRRVGEPPVR